MEGVKIKITAGRKNGLVNNADYQDVLAMLAIANKNLPEMCFRIKNIVENFPQVFYPVSRLANGLVTMGYTRKDFEEAWNQVNTSSKQYYFIKQFCSIVQHFQEVPFYFLFFIFL